MYLPERLIENVKTRERKRYIDRRKSEKIDGLRENSKNGVDGVGISIQLSLVIYTCIHITPSSACKISGLIGKVWFYGRFASSEITCHYFIYLEKEKQKKAKRIQTERRREQGAGRGRRNGKKIGPSKLNWTELN